MRQLKIDLSELEYVFENTGDMTSSYLDSATGEIYGINDDLHFLLEIAYKSYFDEQTTTVDWERAFREEEVPDWQRGMLQVADQIEQDTEKRFISIPAASSHEGFRDMEEFIVTVRNPHLQKDLERAIGGRRPFRHFKDVLLDYPAEREQWFQFKRELVRQRVLRLAGGAGD